MKQKKEKPIRYCKCGCTLALPDQSNYRRQYYNFKHRDNHYKARLKLAVNVDSDPCVGCLIEPDCVEVCFSYQIYHNTAATHKPHIKTRKKKIHHDDYDSIFEHNNAEL